MTELNKLSKPPEFWDYFQEISAIPRCSTNEERIRAYIKEEAEKFNFPTVVDDVGNLLVDLSPETQDAKKSVILQSHFDMVCEKNESSSHDFSKDPLELKVFEKDGKKWVTADGTSLGADNGVGLAYSLVLMNLIHQGELTFPELKIELLFTVNEEGGLVGAFQIEEDMLDTDYLINLDCMDVNTIIIGCVGGMYTNIQIKLKQNDISERKAELIPVKILVTGLLGGHSGLDIDKGRANAIKVLAKVLLEINKKSPILLEELEGGKNFNAIPREAKAIFYLSKEEYKNFDVILKDIKQYLNKYYAASEDNIHIISEKVPNEEANYRAISRDLGDKIIYTLISMPHGPLLRHESIENLVHTSTNLASISSTRRKVKIGMLHRSFNLDFNEDTAERVETLLKLGDFNYKIKNVGGYGVWEPNFTEELLLIAKEVFKEVNNKEPEITAMHAGLEPGAFKVKRSDLQMITIGPNVEACHSPDECLQAQSVEKFWAFLITLLNRL